MLGRARVLPHRAQLLGDIDVFAAESEWNATRARWFVWENVDGRGRFERRTILELIAKLQAAGLPAALVVRTGRAL